MSSEIESRVRLLLDWAALRLERTRVPNVYDNALYSLSSALDAGTVSPTNVDTTVDLLEQLVKLDGDYPLGERFVSLEDRLRLVGGDRIMPPLGYFLGQGVNVAPKWKGEDFYKSVWDLALYGELLYELQPGVIIELGSGEGASADWFATMAYAFGFSVQVLSFDAQPPVFPPSHPSVTFFEARFPEDLTRLISAVNTRDHRRPWLIVEDMHVGVDIVLPALTDLMSCGDYLVVEDSSHKQGVLAELALQDSRLMVDQAYTDKYGLNGTSAMNSILRVA